jgi:uncharacterized protein YjbI with pentapeptide repeats
MDKFREFDILKYQTQKGDVYLENLDIKDCKIIGKPCENIYIYKCSFHNAVFENYFQYCDVSMEESQFKNCEFHGKQGEQCESFEMRECTFERVLFNNQFKDSLIAVENCHFRHCTFRGMLGSGDFELCDSQLEDSQIENINMGPQGESALVTECEFVNCNFKNIDISREIEFDELDIREGKINSLNCIKSDIQLCHFYKVCLENVYLESNFLDNDMDSVIFRNVTLKGTMRNKSDIEENVFIHCDTSGFTYL